MCVCVREKRDQTYVVVCVYQMEEENLYPDEYEGERKIIVGKTLESV